MRFTISVSIATLLIGACLLPSSFGQEEKKAPGAKTEQTKPGKAPKKGRAAAAKGAKAPSKAEIVTEVPFEKTIGQFEGYEQVGPSLIVRPGWQLQVAMTSSGGKHVDWKVLKAAGHGSLGEKRLQAGDRTTMWTNNTGHNTEVIFEADPNSFVDARVTGEFDFHPVKP